MRVCVCVCVCVRGCNTELLRNVLRIILLSTTGKANVFAVEGNKHVSLDLTLYGPCIVKNLRNKNQRDALSF